MIAILAAMATISSARAAAGAIAWISHPVFPNETAIVHGSGLNPSAATVCSKSGGCATATTLNAAADGSSLMLIVPESVPIDVLNVSVGSSAYAINVARPWWLLGSRSGNMTEPGGWVRVFGEGLVFGGPSGCAQGQAGAASLSGVATLQLRNSLSCTGKVLPVPGPPLLTLRSANASCFAAFFAIPSAIQATCYAATLLNDLPASQAGDSAALTAGLVPQPLVINPGLPWPLSPVISVAAGDTQGLVAALAQAGATGQGIVQLAAGITQLPAGQALRIPASVTLQGAGRESTVLLGSDLNGADALLLVQGGMGFPRSRVTDLTVTIDSDAGTAVRVPVGSWGSEIVRVGVNGTASASAMRRDNAIGVYGDGTTVSDCVIVHGGNCTATSWPHNTAHYSAQANNLLWIRNHVTCLCQGYSFDTPRGLAVIDSVWDSSQSNDAEGSGISTFNSPHVAEFVYYGGNTDVGSPTAAKKWESFTTDGPGGAWAGTALSAGVGSPVVLLANSTMLGQPAEGEALVVLTGATAGAVARVSEIFVNPDGTGNVTLADPLPASVGGSDTFACIMPYRGRFAYEGNTFENGTTFQFFGAGVDLHVNNNTFHNFGNIAPWGLWYQGGYQPTLRSQWRANSLQSGGVLRTIGAGPQGSFAGPWVTATAFRSNVLAGASKMSIQQASDLSIVENNVYLVPSGSSAPDWLTIDAAATRVLARANENQTAASC